MSYNKLIKFKTKAIFDAQVKNIPSTSIVFIEDIGQLWTHGKFYGGSNGGDHNHNGIYLPINGTAKAAELVSRTEMVYANLPYTYIKDGQLKSFTSSSTEGYATSNTSGGILFGSSNTAGYLTIRSGTTDSEFYVRSWYNNSFSSWRKLLHSGNFNEFAPTKTGGGASGSWNINAATVTNGVYLTATQTLTNKTLTTPKIHTILNESYVHRLEIGRPGYDRFDFYEYGGIYNFYKCTDATGAVKTLLGKITTNGWEGNVKGNITGNVTGNADSATKLQTSRTIWGNSFDGTANVSGDMTGVNDIYFNNGGKIAGNTSYNQLTFSTKDTASLLVLRTTEFTPYTTKLNLGSTSERWNGIYGNTLNLNGALSGATTINASGKILSGTSHKVGVWSSSNSNQGIFGVQDSANVEQAYIRVGDNVLQFYSKTPNTQYNIWHAGNSNLTTIDWKAKALTLAGAITGATTGSFSGNLSLTGTSTNSTATLNGTEITFKENGYGDAFNITNIFNGTNASNKFKIQYSTGVAGASPVFNDGVVLDGLGNVGIGTASPAYKLDVNGNFRATGDAAALSFGVINTLPTSGKGLSLYNGPTTGAPTYGIMFAGTDTFGKHGGVTSDWATYLTMSDTTTRGWIFRRGSTNVASISGAGTIVATGEITGSKIISNVSTGTSPFTVSSTTAVTNLNADMLDGYHANYFARTHVGNTGANLSQNESTGIITFNGSGLINSPTGGWVNGFKSTHNNYLHSYIINNHRSNNWYFGWADSITSPGGAITWKQVAFTDSNITGNASTADKLKTSRTIWGQSFDGTGNVSGAISGATTGIFSDTLKALRVRAGGTGHLASLHISSIVNEAIFSVMEQSGNDIAYIRIGANKLQFTTPSTGTYNIWHAGNNNIGTGATNYAAGNTQITAASLSASTLTLTRGAGNLTASIPTWNQSTTGSAQFMSINSNVVYGRNTLQFGQLFGAGGTGTNNSTLSNPTNDWYHHIVMNHQNSLGYYTDIATCFHSNRTFLRRLEAGTLKAWVEFAFLDSNVASATKLANTRTIWGQSFDGTGNVSGALSGVTSITSSSYIRASGELQSLSPNSLRIIYGNYGVFWRNDGVNHYLMATAANDQYGGYNSLRPFSFNLTTGRVSIGNGLTVSGRTTLNDYMIVNNDVNIIDGSLYIDSNNQDSWKIYNNKGTLEFENRYGRCMLLDLNSNLHLDGDVNILGNFSTPNYITADSITLHNSVTAMSGNFHNISINNSPLQDYVISQGTSTSGLSLSGFTSVSAQKTRWRKWKSGLMEKWIIIGCNVSTDKTITIGHSASSCGGSFANAEYMITNNVRTTASASSNSPSGSLNVTSIPTSSTFYLSTDGQFHTVYTVYIYLSGW